MQCGVQGETVASVQLTLNSVLFCFAEVLSHVIFVTLMQPLYTKRSNHIYTIISTFLARVELLVAFFSSKSLRRRQLYQHCKIKEQLVLLM